MEEEIKKLVEKYNYLYTEIILEKSLKLIYELLINNTHFEPETDIEYLYYGFYYAKIVNIPTKKLKYYQKAAELNNSAAIYNLGRYYDSVEKSGEKALLWFQKAADLNNSYAMNRLGYYYQKFEKSWEKALSWYQKAADLNNSIAMYNLGRYYQTVEKSWEKALPWFQKAVELNNLNAIIALANYYLNVENNPEKALETYMLNEEENKDCILDLFKNNPELSYTIYLKQQNLEKENLKLKSKVLHYKYRPKGFLNAEKHFINLSKTP